MAARTAYPGTATSTNFTVAALNNLPGGWLGHAELTADSGNISVTLADYAGLSQAVTVNSNRKIRIDVDLLLDGGVVEAAFDVMIREGTTILRRRRYVWAVGSGQISVSFSHTLNPSAGAHTYKVSAQLVTGSGGAHVAADAGGTWGPSSLDIYDVGPSS